MVWKPSSVVVKSVLFSVVAVVTFLQDGRSLRGEIVKKYSRRHDNFLQMDGDDAYDEG
jgi:hypothetical protein